MSTVSAGPPPAQLFLRQHFHRLFEQVARLVEMDLEPAAFAQELLQRTLSGTGAVAGASWSRSSAGHLHLDYQMNRQHVGLDGDVARQAHDALLRQVVQSAQPVFLAPHSGTDDSAFSNSTSHPLLIAPVLVEKQVVGLLEVWLEPQGNAELPAVFLQFLVGMAQYASAFARNRQLRAMASQQQLWVRLEAFSRQVHASLDVREVAFAIANEGRLLVECDRLTVAAPRGRSTQIEAVSGVDVVERRSNQVQLLRRLCEAVLRWGEKLVHHGQHDEGLPAPVQRALDAYLAESNSKLLVVLPLGDEAASPARSALVLECFEPAALPEPMLARLEVVGRHARTALANAAAYRRIPLRWLWNPLATAQDCLGGTRGFVAFLALLVLAATIAALVFIPCPLKMETSGQLLPCERRWLYAPVEGTVVRFEPGLQPGRVVAENQSLVLMHDTQLELKLLELGNEIAAAQEEIAGLTVQQSAARTEAERSSLSADRKQKECLRNRKLAELRALRQRAHADEARPGYFWLPSPIQGTVLTWEFRERLTNRHVKPSDPLLRLGAVDRGWEVEVKIPHRSLGEVLGSLSFLGPTAELDVDLLLVSAPTRTFRGKLSRSQLAGEANADPESNEPEPTLHASVRIDGADIPEAERIPRDLLVTGTEVHAKIRCGDRRMGYALFHGVWEFFCEKVLFF
ncbi:MAG: hypothetical protein K2R98_17595 [Gemmataceae bacterium]|nr:hypothetical protein [Gemmataceae bacterium]